MSTTQIHPTAVIDSTAKLGKNVSVGPHAIIYANVEIKDNTSIGAQAIIGEPYGQSSASTSIGENSIIRSGTIIYQNVITGPRFETGHRATVRENARFGINNRIGTLCDIQGDCTLGDYVRLHSNVHIGKKTIIGNYVWIFPYVVVTNDPHPPSEYLLGVEIADFAVIATSSVLLPGVKIGSDTLVGAMTLVKQDVPDGKVMVGNPGKIICDITKVRNKTTDEAVYPWRYYFDRGMPWEKIGYEKWQQQLLTEQA